MFIIIIIIINCSNESTNETLERTTTEQDLGLELSWRF